MPLLILVSLICSSCLNISDQYQPDQTEWDVTRLADRVKNTRPRGDGEPAQDDINITKHFKKSHFGNLDEPATIVDREGRIFCWHLPDILISARVVTIFALFNFTMLGILIIAQDELNHGTIKLRKPLDQMMARLERNNCSRSGTSSAPWRLSRFLPPPGGGLFGAGSLDFSPGWFQRLHDVSPYLDLRGIGAN